MTNTQKAVACTYSQFATLAGECGMGGIELVVVLAQVSPRQSPNDKTKTPLSCDGVLACGVLCP